MAAMQLLRLNSRWKLYFSKIQMLRNCRGLPCPFNLIGYAKDKQTMVPDLTLAESVPKATATFAPSAS
jgi:hypothetical protein